MKTQIIIALKIFLVMTILTGIIYPLFITVVAKVAFRNQANGSLVTKNGKIIGSKLIGQKFDSSIYFWSRPSATDYNTLPSGGSNLGPTSLKLKKQIDSTKAKFIAENMIKDSLAVPVEMITSSASGLDPHISPEAALLQVKRIAKARNFNAIQIKKLEDLINISTEGLQFGLFGEKRVNVFLLNLKLDKISD
jgi:K+-transporting ATPase ATPase C chain